jgi:MarR family transcriptional regulator, organic hydroperoxide resistance regulator
MLESRVEKALWVGERAIIRDVEMTEAVGTHVEEHPPEVGERQFVTSHWPFFWLTQATGKYLSKLERGLKKVGLDIPRWRVLMCVGPDRQISISEIAELAIVKLPTMMKIIQRMQADGLVQCESRVGDGRVTDVSLTPAGLEARTLAWRTAQRIFDNVFAEIPDEDQRRLNHTLRQIVNQLED